MWTHEMFGVEKPIIALLHLDALPGDPGYCGSMDTVLDHARQDLIALQNGGVDGILFANEPTPGAMPLNVAVGQLNME